MTLQQTRTAFQQMLLDALFTLVLLYKLVIQACEMGSVCKMLTSIQLHLALRMHCRVLWDCGEPR